jgi:site-specific DNA-methyltransferase (adenine-specific)
MIRVLHGDCLDVLATLPDASVDACVTDPPYHLTPNAIRLRNMTVDGKGNRLKPRRAGFMGQQWDGGDVAFRPDTWRAVLRVLRPGAHMLAFGGTRTSHRLTCAVEDAGFEIRDTVAWLYGSGFPKSRNLNGDWQGWGTALKPAFEPIILARKPIKGTVAANVLRHGCGALNIDASRIDTESRRLLVRRHNAQRDPVVFGASLQGSKAVGETTEGRWPANVMHDGSDEVLAAFAAFGEKTTAGVTGIVDYNQPDIRGDNFNRATGRQVRPGMQFGDSGSAARFFYSAKADASDRADSKHPTVKPVDLLRYLVRLITPHGGTVLDPFAGSGTTGEAAMLEGFDAILIERDAQHVADIRHRIKRWSGLDAPLFASAPT